MTLSINASPISSDHDWCICTIFEELVTSPNIHKIDLWPWYDLSTTFRSIPKLQGGLWYRLIPCYKCLTGVFHFLKTGIYDTLFYITLGDEWDLG